MVTINPYYQQMRIDSDGLSECGHPRTKFFTNSLYHESRHAYGYTVASLPGNDADQDFLPTNDIPVAPTLTLKDTGVVRNTCQPGPAGVAPLFRSSSMDPLSPISGITT